MTGVYSTDEPKYAYGGRNEGATGDVTWNTVTIDLAHAADLVEEVYGGMASAEDNTGVVDHNTANMKNGSTRLLYGGYTFGKGAVTNNKVQFDGGAVTKEIMGGIGYHADGNVVTITGGTIGTTTQAADVYGGWAAGPGSSTTGNTVNLGAADGTYTVDLTNAKIHGDNSSDDSVNNNVLNVYGKDVTVKSVDTFDKYNFKLKDNIGDGDTMLTLANGGFGRDIDWNNVTVDLTGQTGNPNGTITLLRTNTANALKFKNYDVRDLVNDPNADYEAFLRTDTDKVAG